jgi:signal transduction histidine kinase
MNLANPSFSPHPAAGGEERPMGIAARPTTVPAPLLGIADEILASRLIREMEAFLPEKPVSIASGFRELCKLSAELRPEVIVLDCELVQGSSLLEPLRQLTAAGPIVVLAPLNRRDEIVRLVAAGEVDFVERAGNFVLIAAALIERRLRSAGSLQSAFGPPRAKLPADIGGIFRHEINNPLTGILGNAELVLSHRDRLAAIDALRLQTVVDLAVRLRETIRRLSDAFEVQSPPAKSA